MRVIKRLTLAQYWKRYPAAEKGLRRWLGVARAAEWSSIDDVRKTYPHADAAVVSSGNNVTIFNIAGNSYRLIVSIKYRWGIVYVRDFLTHAEYNDQRWKMRH